MKTKNILYPFLVIFLCIFGSSCSILAWEPSPITHPFLIGTKDCQPPCWNGLMPGETDFDKALNIVQGFEFINDEGLINVGDDKSFINWYRGDQSNVYLTFYENKLLTIQLYIFIGDLGSVVSHFGEPDGYTVFFDDGAYNIRVFYPNYGLIFFAVSYRGEHHISEDLRVLNVYYLEPGEPNGFPINYYNTRKLFYPREIWYEYYQWEGFGVDLSEKD